MIEWRVVNTERVGQRRWTWDLVGLVGGREYVRATVRRDRSMERECATAAFTAPRGAGTAIVQACRERASAMECAAAAYDFAAEQAEELGAGNIDEAWPMPDVHVDRATITVLGTDAILGIAAYFGGALFEVL